MGVDTYETSGSMSKASAVVERAGGCDIIPDGLADGARGLLMLVRFGFLRFFFFLSFAARREEFLGTRTYINFF
jgi:hypothetical protein